MTSLSQLSQISHMIIVLEPFVFFCVTYDHVTVYNVMLILNLKFKNKKINRN